MSGTWLFLLGFATGFLGVVVVAAIMAWRDSTGIRNENKDEKLVLPRGWPSTYPIPPDELPPPKYPSPFDRPCV